MSRSLGTLTLDLVAKTSGFVSGMSKAERESAAWKRKVKKHIDETTRSLKILGGVAAGGTVAAFAAVTKATIRQEDSLRQIEQRLESTSGAVGRTADELAGLATGLQKVSTFGDEAINEMQGMLLTFTDIRGEVYERALPAILDLSFAMNQDLKASALQLGKALNDPIANLSALSRSGIQFTKEQKETIKTLVEMGDKAEAQSVILQELERQFGGAAAAAADTFGGSIKQLQNAFGDLLENPAGLEANKEALQELTAFLQDPATIQAAQEITSALISGFGAAAEAIRETVGVMKFLGEEMARIQFGAAADDLVRLEQELDKAKSALESPTERLRFFGPGGVIEYWDEEELRAEIDRLEAAISAERQRLVDAFSATGPVIGSGTSPAAAPVAPVAANDPVIGAVGAGDQAAAAGAASQVGGATFSDGLADGASSQSGGDRYSIIEEEHQAHADNIIAIEQAKNAAILEGTEGLFGTLASASRRYAGEQSGIYKTLFAVEKAAAIASAVVNVQGAIAKAANSGPFPANLAAMGTVAAATAGLVTTIASTSIAGQAHAGMMNVPEDGTYILKQGERVVSAETTAKLDSTLSDIKSNRESQAQQPLRIVNLVDSEAVGQEWSGSSSFERSVMNVVTRNRRTVRNL